MSEESKSELYSKNQGLFDKRFTEIIVKTWVGFERTVFEQLSRNDPRPLYTHPKSDQPTASITWYGQAAEELIEDIECGFSELPEGTSLEWSDGTPISEEPSSE